MIKHIPIITLVGTELQTIIATTMIAIFSLPLVLNAQNYGLSEPQDPATLPKSRTEIIMPVKKAKKNQPTILKKDKNGRLVISSGWEMIGASELKSEGHEISSESYNTDTWYNATVPGTILTTLIDQGVYPDPYYGINNLAIPDTLCRMDWWYRVDFEIPEVHKNDLAIIEFEGINYKADIWLNGIMLGDINGAFFRGVFDASSEVNYNGQNILAVHIYPPPNPGVPHEESPVAGTGPNGGQLCKDGPTFISSEGWDWIPGIRDRNIGIWQDVSIKFIKSAAISDPQVITDLPLPDTSRASITITTDIRNYTSVPKDMLLTGSIGEVEFSKKITMPPFETREIMISPDEFSELVIDDPELWWPNGYGKQNLYKLNLQLTDKAGAVSDSCSVRFGIRELSYDLNVDAGNRKNWRLDYNPIKALASGKPIMDNLKKCEVMPGTVIPALRNVGDTLLVADGENDESSPFLVVKVNGKRIYCKGGNCGMDDGLKRVSRERLEPYIRLQRDANFTMIRNWTGESTEKLFYELCDEYGLLVWNDFWLSTEGWNLEVDDNQLFLNNARDVIRRFRNHPSIAIWCARNEGYPIPVIEEGLSQLTAKEDGTRLYQPNSRYLNLRPSGPWHYLENPAEYYTYRAEGFSTELGTPSVPTAETMRGMMAEEDVWPIGDVWWYHDLHDGQKTYRAAIDKLYGGPQNSIEEFCMKAQMINYESHRAMFESWNSKMWNAASGLLIWMSHPAWPSTVWQIYSSDYETHAAYYGAKKACEPLHVQMNLHNDVVTVINTSLKEYDDVDVTLEVFNLNAEIIMNREAEINVASNTRQDLYTIEWTENLPEVCLVRLRLIDDGDKVISENIYWKWNGSGERNFLAFNELPETKLQAKVVSRTVTDEVKIELDISNPGIAIALAVKLNLRDAATDKRILPAFFNDGYFTLLPGETKRITASCRGKNIDGIFTVTSEGYNLERQKLIEIEL